MSKTCKVLTSKELGDSILDSYRRWTNIYNNGASDPTWCDGTNMNLVRNHILYGRNQCESILKFEYWKYPDSYFFPLPPKVPENFMAVSRKVRGEIVDKSPDHDFYKIRFNHCEA